MLLLFYVDDDITRNNTGMISNLIHRLDASFALKDLGNLSYFLGIQLYSLGSGIILNQSKYVDDLLFKLELNNVKPALSPCVVGKQLSISDGSRMPNPSLYRSTVGALSNISHVPGTKHYGIHIQPTKR